MAVQPINNVQNNQVSKKGKKIGTIAGSAGSLIYIGCNKAKINDTFQKELKETILNKGYGNGTLFAVKAVSIAVFVSALAIGGRIIGGLIGKIVDKHNAKKAEKAEKAEKAQISE